MTEAHWTFSVRDQHGRARRGRVVYTDRSEAPLPAAGGPTEFVIVLFAEAADIGTPPPGTAVCLPRPANLRALADADANKLPTQLQDLRFRPYRMASYAAGRIVMSHRSTVGPADIFPAHSEHPRLDRLALAMLETADAEALAPYTAMIRHELHLPPGSDALTELATRLATGDPQSRPPARAPGVLRLGKALRSMRQGVPPETSLEEMTEDLRFLRLFDDDEQPWPRPALERLLGDVRQDRAHEPEDA